MCQHTDSIRAHFDAIDEDTLAAGQAWYPKAQGVIAQMAAQYDRPRWMVAGIIAALSQQCRWSVNIDRAHAVLDGQDKIGGLSRAVDKARRIARGGHPYRVLGKRAYKVQAFYRALMGDKDAAVVDTWMLTALGWEKNGYTRLQYKKLADVLRKEARRNGLHVVTYQAAVWCQVRGASE
jgi:hypothetical protein